MDDKDPPEGRLARQAAAARRRLAGRRRGRAARGRARRRRAVHHRRFPQYRPEADIERGLRDPVRDQDELGGSSLPSSRRRARSASATSRRMRRSACTASRSTARPGRRPRRPISAFRSATARMATNGCPTRAGSPRSPSPRRTPSRSARSCAPSSARSPSSTPGSPTSRRGQLLATVPIHAPR